MQTVHLIDASLYIFRAWHSMPPDFVDVDGAPVNAVHGFTRFLCDFLERAQPTHIAVAFDESLTSSFRNAIYPAYKANRELPPAELKVQFEYCKRVAAAFGHFGGSGTFLWVDPALDRALVCLTDRDFGPWALDAWPSLSDGVIAALDDGTSARHR